MEFIKFIRPKKVIPWTECSEETFQLFADYLDPSPSNNIHIPREIVSRFPFLEPISEQITIIESVETIIVKSSETLSCWSPSPPESPQSSDSDCIILDFPVQRNRIDFTDDIDVESVSPNKIPRFGW